MANTIADKLTYLSGTKDAIKQAIIAKGVDVSDTDTFRSYADKIEAIQSGGGGGIAGAPSGIKFGYSTFTTVPTELFPYLEAQTDLNYMFDNCRSLTTVPLFNTSNVTNMDFMFSNCNSLTSVPQFDTSNVTNMNSMFYYCSRLTTVPLFNTVNVTNMGSMFYNCKSLTNLGGFTGLKVNLGLQDSPKLTIESIVNIINAAADMTSEPKTLVLHQDVFNKLSQEQIATASAKGWNIASK